MANYFYPYSSQYLSRNQIKRSKYKLQAISISSAVAVLTFPLCINVLQRFVWKPLRLSSNLKAAPVFGFLSFAVAHGVTCTLFSAAMVAFENSHRPHSNQRLHGLGYKYEEAHLVFGEFLKSGYSSLQMTTVAVSLTANVAWFLLCGGRLHSLLPSHLLFVGAFGRRGLSCSVKGASKPLKDEIQYLGAKYGCHSCGSKQYVKRLKEAIKRRVPGLKSSVAFISDHQPPTGMVKQEWWNKCRVFVFDSKHFKQALYPQCNACSLKQSSLVKFLCQNSTLTTPGAEKFAAKKSNNLFSRSIVVQNLSFRFSYLWFPFLSYFYLNHNDKFFIKSMFLQFYSSAIKFVMS